jgi:transposase-like protein
MEGRCWLHALRGTHATCAHDEWLQRWLCWSCLRKFTDDFVAASGADEWLAQWVGMHAAMASSSQAVMAVPWGLG